MLCWKGNLSEINIRFEDLENSSISQVLEDFQEMAEILAISGRLKIFKLLEYGHVIYHWGGGALPYEVMWDVPFSRVSFFSLNS